MKKFLILAMGLTLLAANVEKAHAYSSAVGVDPKNDSHPLNGTTDGGYGDYETKAIVKSTVAGKSGLVSKGLILQYTAIADGYTVTRNITRSLPQMRLLACMAMDDIATGDNAYHRCMTRGFAKVRYNATYPITLGIPVCVNTDGLVDGCANGDPEATINTGIIPLESKPVGSGDYLKVMLDLR